MEIRLAKRDGEYFLQYRKSTYINTAPKWKFWVYDAKKIEGAWTDIPVADLDQNCAISRTKELKNDT